MGKSSINGPFSMAMLNNQRVHIYIYIYVGYSNTGFLKKNSHRPKSFNIHRKPRTPCLNVAKHRFSVAGARMAVFFEGSAKHCGHTTLKLGGQRCQTLLARLQVGWLFSSWKTRTTSGSVFWSCGCPPVNSGKHHAVLPTTFACKCDLIKVPPTTQWDVHMWTRASGMLHFRQLLHANVPTSELPPAMQQAVLQHPATLC